MLLTAACVALFVVLRCLLLSADPPRTINVFRDLLPLLELRVRNET